MGILEALGLKERLPSDYHAWKAGLGQERARRMAEADPIEGLTLKERIQAEICAKWIVPVFGGPYRKRRLPITGGKLVDIDSIANVPWPDDIHIDPITFFDKEKNEEVNYISMAADGPNADGKTSHHGSMEYLPDYPDRGTMLRSAADLAILVYRITGHKPLILMMSEERNQHARWCMHSDECPEGYGYDKFVEEYGQSDA